MEIVIVDIGLKAEKYLYLLALIGVVNFKKSEGNQYAFQLLKIKLRI